MEASISNIKEKNGILNFTLSNVNVSISNAIRRTILMDIPQVVFKTIPYEKNKANIIKNTCRLNNEILKQRLSCIPIHINDIETFPYKQYTVEIDEKNDSNIIKYITTEHFKIKDKNTGKYLNDNEKKKIFPPSNLTNDYIVFTRLRPKLTDDIDGEEIKLTCDLDIGTASEDAMYNTVSTCAYGMTTDLVQINKIWTKKELEMKKNNNTTEEINFARKNFMNLDSKRLTLKDSFDFSIETIGIYSNKTLLKKANEILINRINEFKEKFENKKVIINKSDIVNDNSYEIILQDEDYTLGKVFEYILHKEYYEKKEVLSFCGFRKHHPHDSYSVIRVIFNEEKEESDIYSMCIQMCTYSIKIFEKINSLPL
tara:strand:- start:314 stop:1423 length:1110 start_codon:yes stop_codon:yes gene_type:complete